eukprot:12431468-Karenia_brevis.AAC.1
MDRFESGQACTSMGTVPVRFPGGQTNAVKFYSVLIISAPEFCQDHFAGPRKHALAFVHACAGTARVSHPPLVHLACDALKSFMHEK